MVMTDCPSTIFKKNSGNSIINYGSRQWRKTRATDVTKLWDSYSPIDGRGLARWQSIAKSPIKNSGKNLNLNLKVSDGGKPKQGDTK